METNVWSLQGRIYEHQQDCSTSPLRPYSRNIHRSKLPSNDSKEHVFCRSSGTTVKPTPIAHYGDVSASSTWSFRLTGLQVPNSLDPEHKQRAPTCIPSSHFSSANAQCPNLNSHCQNTGFVVLCGRANGLGITFV